MWRLTPPPVETQPPRVTLFAGDPPSAISRRAIRGVSTVDAATGACNSRTRPVKCRPWEVAPSGCHVFGAVSLGRCLAKVMQGDHG
jgi:hypothetical protein